MRDPVLEWGGEVPGTGTDGDAIEGVERPD
jgi:hypothetical protein